MPDTIPGTSALDVLNALVEYNKALGLNGAIVGMEIQAAVAAEARGGPIINPERNAEVVRSLKARTQALLAAKSHPHA